MTRPLTVFLQFTGLIIICVGIGSDMDFGTISVGLGLVIIGGIGHRRRNKR